MDTARESICCKEIDKIQNLLVGDPSLTCITTHPEFPNACLSRTVLTIVMPHEYTTMEPCRDVNMANVDIASLLIFVVVSQTSTGRL